MIDNVSDLTTNFVMEDIFLDLTLILTLFKHIVKISCYHDFQKLKKISFMILTSVNHYIYTILTLSNQFKKVFLMKAIKFSKFWKNVFPF